MLIVEWNLDQLLFADNNALVDDSEAMLSIHGKVYCNWKSTEKITTDKVGEKQSDFRTWNDCGNYIFDVRMITKKMLS